MLNIATLLVLSIAVGFLGSLTGLGGASILVPVLVFLGVPLKEAIACGMVSVIATSSGAAVGYLRERIADLKVAMYLQVFTIVGAIVGASITTVIPAVYLYFFFAAFLMTSFLKLKSPAVSAVAEGSQGPVASWLGLSGSYYDEALKERVDYRVRNALLGGGGMFVAGLAAGMLGIGAGAFKVTVQEHVLNIPPKVSSATSNFIIGMTALGGVSVYLASGLLNLTLMAPMAAGTAIGAIAGGRALNRLSNRVLRILFYSVISIVLLQMLYKGISVL
jgi:uncharacterized membrane protein YfcA